jgi:hypothetical protein
MKLTAAEKALLQPWFARLGRLGGKARHKALSPARRREIAAMGGKARASQAKTEVPREPA